MKTLLALLLLIPSLVFAGEEKIDLVCNYEKIWSLVTGETKTTSGSTSVSIDLLGNPSGYMGHALIKVSNAFCMGIGSYSDSEIFGDCETEYDEMVIQHTFKINRFSGEYIESMGVKDTGRGHVQYGTCTTASRKF